MTPDQKTKLLAFLQSHRLTVISTVDGNNPESALIAFAETENGEIIFGTSDTTRKYKNIQANNNVSFVIGLDDKDSRMTVQYEGVARELAGNEAATYSAMLVAKNPASGKFLKDEHQKYFLVTPTWVRYANYSAIHEDFFEVIF